MVELKQYLKNASDGQSDRHLPLLNSLFVDRFSKFNPYSEDNNFKTFMTWVRRSPHLIGFLNIIATDMLSDDFRFNPLEKESARNKIIKAKNFFDDNNMREVIEETIYDLLITGVGYNWVGKLNDTQLKELCTNVLTNFNFDSEKREFKERVESMVTNLKSGSPEKVVRKLRHVASSTMTIHTNEFEVLGYVQRVGVNTKEFGVDEILNFKLMPLDGKVYPFPPMEALLAEIYLLWLITQNQVSFFENGGKPDTVFILPKEIAGSKNHEYLIETLQKYKKIQNKHGNLVFTGDLTVQQLMQVEQQMENKDLGLYIVGVLAMTYGIPVSRIPFLVGKAANNGDSGGLADSGYWRKISVWQSKLEAVYNKNLWRPYFGVEFEFSRGYMQDEVRETQNEMQKTQIAEQRMNVGLWTPEEAGRYLNIDEDIIKEAQEQKKKRDEEIRSGQLNQNLGKDKKVIPNPDSQLKASVKQSTQLKNQSDSGGKKQNP